MENSFLFLMLIPVLFSILFLISTKKNYIKILSIALFAISSFFAVKLVYNGPQFILVEGSTFHIVEGLILAVEVLIIIFLYYVSIKHKRWGTFALTVIQTGLTVYTTLFMSKPDSATFEIDKLSMVMALIVNIIGTLIVMFSNEYISHYEEHRGMKSRKRLYYFVICIFLSAMNGLFFSDSLSWLYFFWEITTVSSFILISYNKDKEAYDSGFRALFLNLIGGLSFSLGIILFKNLSNIESLSEIIKGGRVTSIYILPVVLLCIAGFAKSAQFPFQSWLLGAMVAPTPISALLHSSTMVKAGVYLIIKLAPAYVGTRLGLLIAIFGGFSFLICSAIAVSQRNAKRVLAYSTIANLGLIISSAGMGTTLAISSAIMLIIFHAISKALLFLCTGQIEHIIGSRDIEDMTGLINKAPGVALLAVFGMLSMILPPFGVLITKWISIEAAASNPLITIFLVLGSTLTTVYYVKWLGTILSHPSSNLKPKYPLEATTYVPLSLLGAMILAASIFITPIFNIFVSPEVIELLHKKNQLVGANGKVSSNIGSFNDGVVFLILIATLIVFLFVKNMILKPKPKRVYMCGENNSTDELQFRNGLAEYDDSRVANFYLTRTINEEIYTKVGYLVSIAIIAAALIGGVV